MSSAVTIPPPNSSSLMRHLPRLTARARNLLTVTNMHFAGIAALLVLNLYLIAHLVFVAQSLNSNNADALASQRASLVAADIAAKPLRGVDTKVAASQEGADRFYVERLPYEYSQFLAELGVLTKKHNVRLTRAQYLPKPLLTGAASLNEVRIDATISGDYRPVVEFINAVERDRMFFLINSITLTGQQTGQVNLRLRMTTYKRSASIDESTKDLSFGGKESPADPQIPGGTQ